MICRKKLCRLDIYPKFCSLGFNSLNCWFTHIFVSFDTENNIPIILGIIVAVVVVISIISIYIYYTYYKKNRMGQYNFKKPKALNGLIAQPAQSPWRNSVRAISLLWLGLPQFDHLLSDQLERMVIWIGVLLTSDLTANLLSEDVDQLKWLSSTLVRFVLDSCLLL